MLELSAALQVSTRQVSNAASKFPAECPGKTEDGYEIEPWRKFFYDVKAKDQDAYAEAKLEKLNLENYRTEQQAEIFRIKRELEEGKVMHRGDVIDVVCGEMLPGMISVLQTAKWEIANKAYGLPREELAEVVETKIQEALAELARGNWVQKKNAFWGPLYAKLLPHLPAFHSGNGPKKTSGGSKMATKKGTPRQGHRSSAQSSTVSVKKKSTMSPANARRKVVKPNSATSSSPTPSPNVQAPSSGSRPQKRKQK
jgi:hypothetical protein